MIRQDRAAIGRWLIVLAGFTIAAGSVLCLSTFSQRGGGAQGTPVRGPNGEVWGFTDTAFNPNTRWRIHDAERPQPPTVTPGETVSVSAPSDAIVLFDGKDLSKWVARGQNRAESPATWPVRDGYFEAQGGNLSTRESFGDVQLHLEYAIPPDVEEVSR
jgi:Domain of Unknown Function (DUF1080)